MINRILRTPDGDAGGGGSEEPPAWAAALVEPQEAVTGANENDETQTTRSASADGGGNGDGAQQQAQEGQGGGNQVANGGAQEGTGAEGSAGAANQQGGNSNNQGLSPEQVAQLAAQTALQTQQNQQQGSGMTDEQMRQAFNIYAASPEVLDALGLGTDDNSVLETRLTTLNNVLQAVAKQAVTLAAYQGQMSQKQLQEQLAPVQEYYQQQQEVQQKQRFMEQYPDLKTVEPLLMSIRDSFVQQQRKFGNEKEAFEAVATEARKMMQSMGVNPGQNQQQRSNTPQPITTLSGGGTGGAGDSQSQQDGKPAWQQALT